VVENRDSVFGSGIIFVSAKLPQRPWNPLSHLIDENGIPFSSGKGTVAFPIENSNYVWPYANVLQPIQKYKYFN
jgi:hypothetical protein